MWLSGDSDILSFIRISRLKNERKRSVRQMFNNHPQGSRLKGRPKADGEIILLDAKLKTVQRGQKQLTGMSPLRRQSFALDCTAMLEEKEEEEERTTIDHAVCHWANSFRRFEGS
jgi:hypothetical protein